METGENLEVRNPPRLEGCGELLRQPLAEQGGITVRWEGASLTGEQSCCSAWPFVQGIIGRSKPQGVRKSPHASVDCGQEPQIRERGEVCSVLHS